MESHSAVRNFQDLLVWKVAHHLTLKVYTCTKSFPREEVYALTSQMRRAAASTGANIAEGSKRKTTKDLCHFLNMAEASNEEVKNFLILSRDLSYIDGAAFRAIYALSDRVSVLLYKLIKSLES